MDVVDVVAVVGSCVPERSRYAKELAAETGRALVPARVLAGAGAAAAVRRALEAGKRGPGVVAELPMETDVLELIGESADARSGMRLVGVVCVADASHLLDDLARTDDVSVASEHGRGVLAHALLAVRQIEYASTVVLVNWVPLPTPALSTVMALVSHLGPRARLRLDRAQAGPLPPGEPYEARQDRAGWLCVLNGEFAPHMTDPRVGAFRYEHVRPLHPGRLHRTLVERVGEGEFGTVVRSAGFCRLATRPRVVAQWEHVGRTICLDPLAADAELDVDEELLALGQELAVIGLDLDAAGLTAALDGAALTDAELAAGPVSWAGFADPFPAWRAIPGGSAWRDGRTL